MSELINIPKSEYINLLNDKQRLNFIENTGITIISFKKDGWQLVMVLDYLLNVKVCEKQLMMQ